MLYCQVSVTLSRRSRMLTSPCRPVCDHLSIASRSVFRARIGTGLHVVPGGWTQHRLSYSIFGLQELSSMALQEPLSQAGFPGLDYMSPQGLDFASPFHGQMNMDTWAPLGGLAAVANLRIVPPMGYAWAGSRVCRAWAYGTGMPLSIPICSCLTWSV